MGGAKGMGFLCPGRTHFASLFAWVVLMTARVHPTANATTRETEYAAQMEKTYKLIRLSF